LVHTAPVVADEAEFAHVCGDFAPDELGFWIDPVRTHTQCSSRITQSYTHTHTHTHTQSHHHTITPSHHHTHTHCFSHIFRSDRRHQRLCRRLDSRFGQRHRAERPPLRHGPPGAEILGALSALSHSSLRALFRAPRDSLSSAWSISRLLPAARTPAFGRAAMSGAWRGRRWISLRRARTTTAHQPAALCTPAFSLCVNAYCHGPNRVNTTRCVLS
jgi:hypothetical protein